MAPYCQKLVAAALLAAFRLAAQTDAGTVRGRVLDRAEQPVQGARVRIEPVNGGVERIAESGAGGGFAFPSVAPGEFRLRVDHAGMAPLEVASFTVAVGQTVTHRLVLEPAHVIERVEVREQPEALQTAANTSNTSLGNDRIEETPASGRNYLNFVLTAPGAAPSAGSNARRSAASVRGPASDSGFTFAGVRSRNNSLSIDGVDNRDETTGGNRVAIGLEMVAEFRVSGTSAGAEYGNAAGGIVNVVTRSGTNLWHGDATFFAQHERANARNPEALVDRRPRFRRLQPGVSVNGPARRDRTFFSTAIEQQWESSEEWSEAPAGSLEAIAREMARRRLWPDLDGVRRGLVPALERQTEFSFKGNHQQGARHALSARYAFSRGRVDNDLQDVDNFTDQSARGSSLTRDHSLVAGWTALVRPAVVNDLRAQWSRRDSSLTPNSRGPMAEIPGVVTFGQSGRLDADRAETHVEAVESLQIARGRHQITLGASVHPIRLDARLANRFGGILVFPTLAHFLSGAPPAMSIRAVGRPETSMSTTAAGAWISDRWQAASGLTIEPGVRYDRQSMPDGLPESNRNIAPRLGVAWNPGGKSKWVARAAAGLFFDRSPLAFWNEAVQKGPAGAAEERYAIDGGPAMPSLWAAGASMPATYSAKLTAGLERGLDADTTLTVEASAVRGLHLPRVRNAAMTLPARFEIEQTARSAYGGVAVSLNRRMSKELTYLVAWNAGRTNDDASDYDEHPMLPGNVRADWARSRQHQAQRITASALFELPETIEALEHLTIAPIVSAGSGRPLNAISATDELRTGAWPVSARPFGLARNAFRTRGQFSADIRVMKTFPFDNDRSRLQVGVDVFNLTNRSNPLRFSPYHAALGVPIPSYGGVIETLSARQVQFLVQFEY